MKNIVFLLGFILVLACGNDDDSDVDSFLIEFSFTHNWDGVPISSANFNSIQYTNANGEELSIERLRYLVSNVTFTEENFAGIKIFNGYNLVDVTNDEGLTYNANFVMKKGTYDNVSFIFGLPNSDNLDGIYQDLNSASFNVPMMLGGGYHYMQFDGKYINDAAIETGFNYHAIRAVDNPGANPTFPQDTFFTVNLGPITIIDNTNIEIKMNVAEWFKNPHTWNLNDLDTVLMPNSAAQIMMHDNGQTVFSLGEITQ